MQFTTTQTSCRFGRVERTMTAFYWTKKKTFRYYESIPLIIIINIILRQMLDRDLIIYLRGRQT